MRIGPAVLRQPICRWPGMNRLGLRRPFFWLTTLLSLICLAAPALAQSPPQNESASTAPGAAPGESTESEASAVPAVATGIRGMVVDDTGLPLMAATVEVISGSGESVYTEEDGSFELPVQPGNYRLRVTFPMYEVWEVDVAVAQGQEAEVTITLPLAQEAGEVIVMEGRVERDSEGAQLQLRRVATVVSDVLSRQEIARTPDSSASDAVKRVPSVTVDEGTTVPASEESVPTRCSS